MKWKNKKNLYIRIKTCRWLARAHAFSLQSAIFFQPPTKLYYATYVSSRQSCSPPYYYCLLVFSSSYQCVWYIHVSFISMFIYILNSLSVESGAFSIYPRTAKSFFFSAFFYPHQMSLYIFHLFLMSFVKENLGKNKKIKEENLSNICGIFLVFEENRSIFKEVKEVSDMLRVGKQGREDQGLMRQ